ncbi:MAG: hypothetical protein ABSH38_08040 [Verrucomicrobiota bacterium]|jgi:hypothetical protein
MTKEAFEKILNEKSRDAEESKAIDWEGRKRAWLQDLESFYRQIEDYIAPYTRSGKMAVRKSNISITEERLGTYEAPAMTIALDSEKVELCPVGTLLIGAKGRVDMAGRTGVVKFILTGRESTGVKIPFTVRGRNQAEHPPNVPKTPVKEEYVWKIATEPPKVRFIELTQETFFSAFAEVVDAQ